MKGCVEIALYQSQYSFIVRLSIDRPQTSSLKSLSISEYFKFLINKLKYRHSKA